MATQININESPIVLARTIGKIHTYIDIISAIAKKQNQNSFWNLVGNSLYDLTVIESFKLIDKKNLSVFSLIKQVKGAHPDKTNELDKDYEVLDALIKAPDFHLERHRHTQKAHIPQKINAPLPRYADLSKIKELLDSCETLIKKYYKWIKGPIQSIPFRSSFAGGHEEILDYVSKTIC